MRTPAWNIGGPEFEAVGLDPHRRTEDWPWTRAATRAPIAQFGMRRGTAKIDPATEHNGGYRTRVRHNA
jgi:hypothetical protein